MAKRKPDTVLLAEIREVIASVTNDFRVKCYGNEMQPVGIAKGDFQRLRECDGYYIIKDLLEGNCSSLTRDYLRTRKDAARAARRAAQFALGS
jgi:hypothetical protein